VTGTEFLVEALVCGPLQNNVYVVASSRTGEALVVDPGLGAQAAVTAILKARNLRLTGIVATHYHWDHIGEAGPLASAMGAPVLAHELDAPSIVQPPRPMMFPELEVPPAPVARELRDGDLVGLDQFSFQVLHTPGHTPGSMCLYLPEQSLLLSGDTLFAGSYGRYDLPGGDRRLLGESLRRLAELPPETRVLPGHGPETTIGRETWLRQPPI
jgi:hydroxyacylglutathione hydrolase